MYLSEREVTLTLGLVPIGAVVVAAMIADYQSQKRKKTEIKRIAYAKLLTSIEEISDFVEEIRDEPGGLYRAYTAMNSALAMMDLVAPKEIHEKATDAFRIAKIERGSVNQAEVTERKDYLNKLTSLMRLDLGFESDAVDQDS